MVKLIVFIAVIGWLNCASADYAKGPFVLWGLDSLKTFKSSALQTVEESDLWKLYSQASAIVIFLKNGSEEMNNENFPEFNKLVHENVWAYWPQHTLLDPHEFNLNIEIVNLSGPTSQQDTEITALYKDSVLNYGKGRVLGIFASKRIPPNHIQKREAETATDTPATTSNPVATTTNLIPTTEEPLKDDYTYNAEGKAILHTASAMILHWGDDESNVTTSLIRHNIVTSDERDSLSRLIVTFVIEDQSKLTLRFKFPILGGYWSLTSVEVEDSAAVRTVLNVVGKPPTAPIGFSYKCSQTLVFRHNSTYIKINNIQVQPSLNGATKFSDAYDCVGFTSVPIWSGVLVTFLLMFVLSIAIIAILDIKPPNRFESSRSKQLTFTIQE